MMFSVVIPTYNRIQLLKQTIQSVFSQQYSDYQLIVINDGGSDGSHEYLEELATAGKITYVNQRNMGPAAARNAGIRVARGIYLAFTDDDCLVPPNWLGKIAEAFSEQGIEIVGGAVKNCIQGNIYSEVSQDIVNHFVTFLNERGLEYGFLTSNNIAYRTDVVRTVGGFDERFRAAGGEERALNASILRRGGKSRFLPHLVVDHYHAMTAWSFFRQQRNYGRGSYHLYRRQSAPPGIPPVAYTTLAISWLKRQPLLGVQKVILFFSAQFMVACGFVVEAFSQRSHSHAAKT